MGIMGRMGVMGRIRRMDWGREIKIKIKIRIEEEVGPVAGFFEGFAGLAFAAGEDEPVGFGCEETVENGFGGAGVVLAGLTSPEADFEAGGVVEPFELVREEGLSIVNGAGVLVRVHNVGLSRW
jgi:hypothetical protein